MRLDNSGSRRKGKLLTPKATQSRVIAAAMAGKSNRRIAQEVGLDRDTVAKVLSQPEIMALLQGYRAEALALARPALVYIGNRLLTKAGKVRSRGVDWKMCIEILKGVQVFVTRMDAEITQRPGEFEGWTDEELEEYVRTGEPPESKRHIFRG
jgi:hypothetical protein